MKLLMIALVFLCVASFGKEIDVPLTSCRVSRVGEHYVAGNRCYSSDEVMEGLDSNLSMIRCARLNVTCTITEDQIPSSPEKADPVQ